MKLMSLAAAFCALILSGCSQMAPQSQPQENVSRVQALSQFGSYAVGKLFLDQGFQKQTASFVQWNDEYAVTAKHVPGVDGQAYLCGVGCDLQFFRHKAEVPFAQWRAAVPQESLSVVGFNLDRGINVSRGHDASRTVTDSPTLAYSYRTGKTVQKTAGGMSGGPVYANDKKVVGMHIGSEEGTEGTFIYVPYELVLSEWNKFSASQSMLQATK